MTDEPIIKSIGDYLTLEPKDFGWAFSESLPMCNGLIQYGVCTIIESLKCSNQKKQAYYKTLKLFIPHPDHDGLDSHFLGRASVYTNLRLNALIFMAIMHKEI